MGCRLESRRGKAWAQLELLARGGTFDADDSYPWDTEVRAGQSNTRPLVLAGLLSEASVLRSQSKRELVSEPSAPIHSHTSLPVALMRAMVSCWGLAVQRRRPVLLGDSGFSLSQADRVHVGGLQDSLGGNQAGRLRPWQGFWNSSGAGTSTLLTGCRARLPGCCLKPLLDVRSHSEVAPAAHTHP